MRLAVSIRRGMLWLGVRGKSKRACVVVGGSFLPLLSCSLSLSHCTVSRNNPRRGLTASAGRATMAVGSDLGLEANQMENSVEENRKAWLAKLRDPETKQVFGTYSNGVGGFCANV